MVWKVWIAMDKTTCSTEFWWSAGSADLEKGFANKGGPKEVPEWHQEVTTADAAQVKGCIGPGCQ